MNQKWLLIYSKIFLALIAFLVAIACYDLSFTRMIILLSLLILYWRINDLVKQLQRSLKQQEQKNQQLEQEVIKTNLLSHITKQIRSNLRIEEIFQTTVDSVGEAFEVSRCHLITQADFLLGYITAEYCVADYPKLIDISISGEDNPHLQEVFSQEKAIALTDVFPYRNQIKSMLLVRTSYQEKDNGCLVLHQCDRIRQWTPAEIDFLESVADSVGIALAHAQLLEKEITRRIQLDTRNKQLQAEVGQRKQIERALEGQLHRELLLSRITYEIRQNLNSEAIFQTTANQVGYAFQVNRCLIHTYLTLPQPTTPIVAEYLESGMESLLNLIVPITENPHMETLLQQDKAIASPNVYQDELLQNATSICQQIKLKSMLAVRTSYQGEPNGCIGLHQCDRFRQWTSEEIALLEAVAAQVGIAIAQAKLLEQEQQQRQELEIAKQKAEVASLAKSEFLAKMSHELRTPLNAILGFSQVMYRNADTTPEQKETLGIINSSGEHLLSLINDVLDMSKIESGKITVYWAECDLFYLLDSLYLILHPKAEEKGIKLVFEIAPDLPVFVKLDEGKLRQILINLLGNAIKFTNQGSVTLRVTQEPATLENSIYQHHLFFTVIDTGIGMTPEEINHLFQPFVQTESGKQLGEGTGLGLAISQKFIHMMDGTITVESKINQGTKFELMIPGQFSHGTAINPIQPKSDRQIICLEPQQPDCKILIVEDQWENRLLLVDLLGSVGFITQEASNGEQAISIAQSWQPDLILMDIEMPVLNGYEATKQLKQIMEAKCPIIIAITANAFSHKQEKMLSVGCADFIAKPFKTETLLEILADQLQLQYVYQTKIHNLVSPEIAELSPAEIDLQLGLMSEEWLEQMKQAAIALDNAMILDLISQMPDTSASLATMLQKCLENFRFDKIAKCLNH